MLHQKVKPRILIPIEKEAKMSAENCSSRESGLEDAIKRLDTSGWWSSYSINFRLSRPSLGEIREQKPMNKYILALWRHKKACSLVKYSRTWSSFREWLYSVPAGHNTWNRLDTIKKVLNKAETIRFIHKLGKCMDVRMFGFHNAKPLSSPFYHLRQGLLHPSPVSCPSSLSIHSHDRVPDSKYHMTTWGAFPYR